MTTAKPSLSILLERRSLRQFAGSRSFERGQDYFRNGHVTSLAADKGKIVATVDGARRYRVRLSLRDGDLDYSCTCPVGTDGDFCKHCVATALASLKERRSSKPTSERPRKKSVTVKDAREYLLRQDKKTLVEMLIEQAMNDESLRRRLFVKAAATTGAGLDTESYRQAIDEAVRHRGFVEDGDAYEYSHAIAEAVDGIAELMKAGHPNEVLDLAEYALERVEDALESVDDSSGFMGGLLDELQKLHLQACTRVRPDPEALARRLLAWELQSDYDVFRGAAATYADVLGETGLAVYRKLAEAEWSKIPAVKGASESPSSLSDRYRITHIMETLAGMSGDVEELVAIKKRDLSAAWHYLAIAEIYKKARKHDLALEWAERGDKQFPERTDARLRQFLADEYHRRKRHDEAMTLAWSAFTDAPTLESYRDLKAHADHSGQWMAWRDKALNCVKEKLSKAKPATRALRPTWQRPEDHSELVRIFLWEKDSEAAWREAQAGGCSNPLWLELAAAREKLHPEDALSIYQRQIEPALSTRGDEAYKIAIDHLRKIRALMRRLGRQAGFAPYLESVKAAHKRKRNFMKRLERVKWREHDR